MQFNLKLTEKGAIYVTSQQPVDIHGKPYNRSLVGVLLIGTFCTILNQTLLTTALPTLMKEFDISAFKCTVANHWIPTCERHYDSHQCLVD